MSYDGPFTFINSDPKNAKSKGQNSAVLSHVVGTHRKWHKVKRLEQLNRYSSSSPIGRVPICRSTKGQAASTTRSISPDVDQKRGSPSIRTSSFTAPEHDASCKCTSCLRGQIQEMPVSTGCVISLSQPLTKGDSDPFACSSVAIAAQTNEYLQLSSQFYVFWAWPVHASALFRKRAHEDWLSAVKDSFHQSSEMHAMLAGGAYVRADLSTSGTDIDRVRATSHKMQAMSQLRKRLIDKDPKSSADLLWTVLRLMGLEVYAGNFEAAIWHYHAAKQIISYHKFPDWHHDSDLNFFVAEAWICTALLQKPAPLEVQEGRIPRLEEPSLGRLDSRVDSEVEKPVINEAVPRELHQLFHDIQRAIAMLLALTNIDDEEQRFQIVTYLDTRAAVLRARILTSWVDFSDQQKGETVSTAEKIYSACCMASLIFVNFIFMPATIASDMDASIGLSRPSAINRILHKAFTKLHQDLSYLSNIWKTCPQSVDSKLILWLCFIAELGGEKATPVESSMDYIDTMTTAVKSLSLNTWKDARVILKQFLFHETTMDGRLEELISAATRPGVDRDEKIRFRQTRD